MSNVDVGLKVLINSYILELRKHISVMNNLMSELYDNLRLTDSIELKLYYRTQIKKLEKAIDQHDNLINTLENFKEKGIELKWVI